MLVTFRSKAAGDVMMFGDVAIQLLKLMGASGDVPGAIAAEDIPAAIARLEASINNNQTLPTADSKKDQEDNDSGADFVSLRTRAVPLINLLKTSAAADTEVMWDK